MLIIKVFPHRENPAQIQKSPLLREFFEQYGTQNLHRQRSVHCTGPQDIFALNVTTA
jgi:hypothetical protein